MKKLVEEKQETKGTIAKFGIFWGLLVLPFVVAKRFRAKRQAPISRLQRLLKRLPGR
jgi:hypothetical protein